MTSKRPNPHPLDYDWRFSSTTADRLAVLCTQGRTLALGVPTVAAKLSRMKEEVTLIDSHPIQEVANHLCLDINLSEPLKGSYDFIVMDPPWYLDVYYRWLSWAANSSNVGTKIFLSIWPDSTRPLAQIEKNELFEWISDWADLEYFENHLEYQTPQFEKMSYITKSNNKKRLGDLVIITIKKTPTLKETKNTNDQWIRYLFNDYQLAIKLEKNDNNSDHVKLNKLENANEWIWPSVSKRTSGREKIQIWSSENEVGGIDNPTTLIHILDRLNNPEDISYFLEHAKLLSEWKIPLPPYTRKLKWNQVF